MYLLGYDIGTSSVKASLVEALGGRTRRISPMPGDAMTVEVSRQVRAASLTGLDYNLTYHYVVAFVTISDGDAYYGEEQVFSTGEDPTDIGGHPCEAIEERTCNRCRKVQHERSVDCRSAEGCEHHPHERRKQQEGVGQVTNKHTMGRLDFYGSPAFFLPFSGFVLKEWMVPIFILTR